MSTVIDVVVDFMNEHNKQQQTGRETNVVIRSQENAKTHVFISYSRVDSNFAKKLCDRLKSDGYEAYMDVRDIAKGEVPALGNREPGRL